MSQHFLQTSLPDGRPVKIQAGWDRPLQGYYLVVERLDVPEDADDDEIYLFSNLLHMPRGGSHPKTMLPFFDRLKQIGLALPIPMLAELDDDRVTNAGNRSSTDRLPSQSDGELDSGDPVSFATGLRL